MRRRSCCCVPPPRGTQPLGSHARLVSVLGGITGCLFFPVGLRPFILPSFPGVFRFATRHYTSWGALGAYVAPWCVSPLSRLCLLRRLAHRAPCGVSQVPATAPANLVDLYIDRKLALPIVSVACYCYCPLKESHPVYRQGAASGVPRYRSPFDTVRVN